MCLGHAIHQELDMCWGLVPVWGGDDQLDLIHQCSLCSAAEPFSLPPHVAPHACPPSPWGPEGTQRGAEHRDVGWESHQLG